jgi:hypothetical protein
MQLTIPLEVYSKLNYFLKKFPSTEWSGPAWYKPHYKKGDKFPTGFTLIHFHPVDLGHGTATTIEAEDTAKILEKTWKNYPETEKCMMGIIHSHHSMGAFFSGTDKSCLKDNAPDENFYCSTVVASAKEKFAFALSYKDQYDKVHLIEAESKDINMTMPVDNKEQKKWETIAKKIEKSKEETIVTRFYKGGSLNQGNLFPYRPNSYLFDNYDELDTHITKQDKIIDDLRQASLTADDPDSAFISSLYESFTKGDIEELVMEDALIDMNLNPRIVLDELTKGDNNATKVSA